MPQLSNDDIIHRYLDAQARHDYDAMAVLRAPGWTFEMPQSGERIRGHANALAVMTNWPAGQPESEDIRVVGSEDRWVMTPAWTYQRVVGSGDAWWADAVSTYPDGSTWLAAGLFEIRDGQVQRETWYFAPMLDAPAWRAQWVERMNPEERSHGR